MQSSSATSSTSMPTSLEDLQGMARACFQTTSHILKEHAELARQAANERVQIARAGKALLDEGGEMTAQVVLAKKASLDAADLDKSIKTRVHVAAFKLDDSVAKLKAVQPTEGASIDSFGKLAAEHEVRATACKQIAQLLITPASSAEMSPEECDALAIVQAKLGCTTIFSKTSESLESMRQRALASIPAPNTEQSSSQEDPADAAQQPTLLQGLHGKAHSGLHKVKLAANDRFETARAGKRLLDEGGENVAQVVVAKKACCDAAEIDRDIAQRVQSAISSFVDSAAKLRAVTVAQEAEGTTANSDLVKLAEEHELRAETYRQIADMLDAPMSSVDMNLAEWDALALVKVKDTCGTLQSRTNDGFEVVKGMIFSGCSSGAEHLDQKRRTVCA